MNGTLQNKASEIDVFNKAALDQSKIIYNNDIHVEFLNEIGLTKLDSKSAHRLLEVGCFTGNLSFLLEAYGFQVTGIDIANEAIKKATDLARSQKSTVHFLVADAEELDKYFRREFDIVFCNCVLHHLYPDPSKVISGVSKVLKFGGLFFCAEPNPYNPYNILVYFIKDIVYKFTSPSSNIHTYIHKQFTLNENVISKKSFLRCFMENNLYILEEKYYTIGKNRFGKIEAPFIVKIVRLTFRFIFKLLPPLFSSHLILFKLKLKD